MLDLSLFRSGTYTGANVAMLLVALAMFGVFFFVSLYMQNVLGYSAVQAGAAFLPMTVLIILVAPIAGKPSDKYGSRWLMTIGMVLLGVQLLYLSQLGADAELLEPPAGLPRRRARDGAGDDADRRRGDARRAGAQVRRRLGRAERDAAGRRLGRDRPDGRDRRRPRRRTPGVDGFMAGFERALFVAALIAFAGSIVAFALVRQETDARSRRRVELAA